eukprot:2804408-Rhodomonas_salina.1
MAMASTPPPLSLRGSLPSGFPLSTPSPTAASASRWLCGFGPFSCLICPTAPLSSAQVRHAPPVFESLREADEEG